MTVLPKRLTLERLGVGDSEVNRFGVNGDMKHTKKSEKMSKSQNLAKSRKKSSKSGNSTNFNAIETGPKFLTSDARTAFNYLQLAFIEASIFWHFDPKYHIWIETNAMGYAIDGMLSQLTSRTSPHGVVIKTDLGQWHPVVFFLRKMILAETWYETHNSQLLAIVKAFKIWHHYLESWKYELFVLINHNNFRCFMDTKSLSSRQVH